MTERRARNPSFERMSSERTGASQVRDSGHGYRDRATIKVGSPVDSVSVTMRVFGVTVVVVVALLAFAFAKNLPGNLETGHVSETAKATPKTLEKAPEKLGNAPEKLDNEAGKLKEVPPKLEKAPEKLDEALEKIEKAPEKLDNTREELEKEPVKHEKGPEKLEKALESLVRASETPEKTSASLEKSSEAPKAEATLEDSTKSEARVSYSGSQLWRVDGSKNPDSLKALLETPDLNTWLANETVADLIVEPEKSKEIESLLRERGLQYTVSIEDLQAAINDENPQLTEEELELQGRKGHRMTWSHYHRAQDILGFLDYVAQTYPDVCSVQSIGTSVEGRPLKVLKIAGRPGSPSLWVDGGIHAREWITSASVTYLINELVENRAPYESWLSRVNLYILPLVNPDGYEHSHVGDRLWRKNRRSNGGFAQCSGTDLNRNWGYKWGGEGASNSPCRETFRGTGPFSEPETNALQRHILSLSNLKEELTRAKSKMVATSGTASVGTRSNEDFDVILRERDEHIAKLNAEVTALQEMAETTRNLRAVNANLQREVERLQREIAQPQTARSTTSQSSNLVSELERVRSELDSKKTEMKRLHEDLRAAKEETSSLKANLDQNETLARTLETTVTGLRANLATEKEKAAEHERATVKDAARIRDLDRQVKELEGIVMRQKKHQAAAVLPGSNASALAQERRLQERIDKLEAELSDRQTGVTRLQTQLASVKTKYEDLIANLEQKLANSKEEISELKGIVAQSHRETSVNATQTTDKDIPAREVRSESTDGESAALQPETATKDSDSEPAPKGRRRVRGTAKRRSASAGAGDVTRGSKAPVRRASASMDVRTSASSRQDIHLICTIRGLQQELSARDRDVQRLQRELNDVRATNRRLQQERERLLKQNATTPVSPTGNCTSGSTTTSRARPSKKGDTLSSKTDVGVQVKDSAERSFDASNSSYDPAQFEANDSEHLINDLQRENRGLRDDVVRLQEDLLGLHAKRATDINRLQSKHDEEIQRIIERHSGPRTGAARVADLQGQLYTQQLVITHLKEQLKQLEKTAKEVALLKKERDHLEETVVEMTKKISRLRDMHTPDTVKYAALQDKVDELEARHECRERKLQAIVRDLQQQYSAASCGGCGPSCGLSAGGSSAGEGCSAATRLLQKNRDLCLYRAELDRLLTALRQLDALRKNNQPE